MKRDRSCLLIPLCAAVLFPFFQGCGPTYPKENIEEAAQRVIKKEYKVESRAELVGETLYLNINLPGLTTTEPGALAELLRKVQGAVLAITRVSLSSDASIKFLVVTANDPAWELGLRIIQSLQDVKDFLYQRISRSDYEERLVLEIDSEDEGNVHGIPHENGKDISLNEFAGRLIVSQFNMMCRNNPFLGAILDGSKMKYGEFRGDELVIRATSYFSPGSVPLVEKLFETECNKVIKKYSINQLKRVKIIGQKEQTVSIMLVH